MDGPMAVRLAAFFEARPPGGLVSAYLFGSHATGTAHRESDVDVAVLTDRAEWPTRQDRDRLRVALGSELVEALHHNEIDVVCLQDAPPELARRVVTTGTRVFCADPLTERAFARDVQLRAADLDPFLRRMRALMLERLLK